MELFCGELFTGAVGLGVLSWLISAPEVEALVRSFGDDAQLLEEEGGTNAPPS